MRLFSKQYLRQPHFVGILQATFIFCTLLKPILTEDQMEPEFAGSLNNYTIIQGNDVHFTCTVNHLSNYKVAWIKLDTKAILSIHTSLVAQNPRITVTYNGINTWKLHISNVQLNDSGVYACQINTDPLKELSGSLQVVIPPDILHEDDESMEDMEGGTTTLRCSAIGVPDPTVTWKREDGKNFRFGVGDRREENEVDSFEGETLVLTNVRRTDMGVYLCIANNGIAPSVSKRFMVQVHFHPLVRASDPVVTAPIDSDVPIQCYVESSPSPMNHWRKENGEKLTPNDKYVMEETTVNDYSLLMKLTICNLEKEDFGGYVCSSSNALGKAEGMVQVQELQ